MSELLKHLLVISLSPLTVVIVVLEGGVGEANCSEDTVTADLGNYRQVAISDL